MVTVFLFQLCGHFTIWPDFIILLEFLNECQQVFYTENWELFTMPTLTLLVAQQVVIRTNCGTTSDDKVGIIITPCFQCSNSLWFSCAIWYHRTWSTLVQVMACCQLLISTKPLFVSILTEHHCALVAFTREQFHRKCSRYLSLIWVWKLLI